MKYSGPERRKHPRLPISARVKFPNSGEIDYMIAVDVCEAGIGIACDHPIKLGESLKMEISISGVDKLIKVTGIIVRERQSKPAGYGIKFTRFAPYSKIRLKKALDDLIKV